MEPFTEADIMLIEKEVTRLSYKEIAFLVDRCVEDVSAFIDQWKEHHDVITKESLLQQKKSKNHKLQFRVVGKKNDQQSGSKKKAKLQKEENYNTVKTMRVTGRKRVEEQRFQTKQVDLSKLVSVRIDAKTCIYIKPDEDPVKAKEKYFSRLSDSRTRMTG